MTTLDFYSFTLIEDTRPVTIEEMFKFYTAKAGIDSFSFSDLAGPERNNNNPLFINPSTGGTVNLYNGVLSNGTGSVAGVVAFQGDPNAPESTPLPNSYLLELTVTGTETSPSIVEVFAKANALYTTYIRVYYTSGTASNPSQVFITGVGDYANYVQWYEFQGNLGDLPNAGRLEIGVYESQYESDSTVEVWVGVWMNRKLIAASTLTGYPSINISNGLAFNNPQFDRLRISDQSEIIPFTSSDPGSNFINAIQLALEDRYVKFFSKGDGALRVQTPYYKVLNIPDGQTTPNFPTQLRDTALIGSGDSKIWYMDNAMILDGVEGLAEGVTDLSSIIVNDSFPYMLQRQTTFDYNQIKTHARMLGAFNFVQQEDAMLQQLSSHRYVEVTSSSSYNTASDLEQAKLFFHKVRESIYRVEFVTEGFICMEPEDLVIVSTHLNPEIRLPFWVDTVSWQSGPGMSMQCTLSLRLASPILTNTPSSAFPSGAAHFGAGAIFV
jgi:hypothetical protein